MKRKSSICWYIGKVLEGKRYIRPDERAPNYDDSWNGVGFNGAAVTFAGFMLVVDGDTEKAHRRLNRLFKKEYGDKISLRTEWWPVKSNIVHESGDSPYVKPPYLS